MAVLSLGLGIAALVSSTKRRGLAIAGVSGSALTLVAWLALNTIAFVLVMNATPQLSG